MDSERGEVIPFEGTEEILSKASSREAQHISETEMRLHDLQWFYLTIFQLHDGAKAIHIQ